MKFYVLSALLPLALAGTAGAVESTFFPGNEPEDSPRVMAYYQSQCEQWSKADWIQTDQRASYTHQCVVSMADVRPIGFEAGGEDE